MEIKFRCFLDATDYEDWHQYAGQKVMLSWEDLKASDDMLECYFDEDISGVSKPMQYTGLKDKNGVEIYDGDIIAYGDFALNDTEKYGPRCWESLPDGVERDDISTVKSIHEVTFYIPSLMAIQQAIENNPDVSGVEVIGNIYETPELLNKA